jgi:hypothetical protein
MVLISTHDFYGSNLFIRQNQNILRFFDLQEAAILFGIKYFVNFNCSKFMASSHT